MKIKGETVGALLKFKQAEFSCTTADEAEQQFEGIHWSDLAEALTETSGEYETDNHNQWFGMIELFRNHCSKIALWKSCFFFF